MGWSGVCVCVWVGGDVGGWGGDVWSKRNVLEQLSDLPPDTWDKNRRIPNWQVRRLRGRWRWHAGTPAPVW